MSIIKSNAVAPPPASGGSLSIISEMNSLRFDGSSYLSRTFGSGNRKTWTWSGWVKRSHFSSPRAYCLFGSYQPSLGDNDNTWFGLNFFQDSVWISGWSAKWRTTQALYRDPNAWYHVVCAVNSTEAVGDDRIKIYVNGSRIVDFKEKNNPAQNFEFAVNVASSDAHGIGDIVNYSTKYYANGYLANIQFIDGQALDANSFGETVSDIWVPKQYGSGDPANAMTEYGTNGFHLDFAASNMDFSNNKVLDASGRGNDWTLN